MILKTSKNIFNFLRYFFAGVILFAVFYSPSIIIDNSYIQEAIDKKIPFTKKKKHTETTINSFKITDINDKVVHLDILGKVKYKTKVLKVKISKSFKFLVQGVLIPKLSGHYLTFDLLRLDVKKIPGKDYLEKLLAKKIKRTKIYIKDLKRIDQFATIKNIRFLDNGDLLVNYKLTKWILLFVILFLIFETKYILLISKKTKRAVI